jgi:hypothetical protein
LEDVWGTSEELESERRLGAVFEASYDGLHRRSISHWAYAIMLLHESRLKTVLTASICVFAFGLGVDFFLEKPFDVMSATASYAAVLVVFVGTGSNGGNGT